MLSWRTTGPFPSSPAYGTRAQGKAYENKVGKRLKTLSRKQEWLFRDHEWLNRKHSRETDRAIHSRDNIPCSWLQPDFCIETPTDLYLFEAKLTYQLSAFEQLSRYADWIVELERQQTSSTPRPLTQIQVCRNLTPDSPKPFVCFGDIQSTANKPEQILWHLFL